MATIQIPRNFTTGTAARAVDNVSTVTRVNRVPVSQFGAVARVPGPSGRNAPLSSITFTLANATSGALTYVIGDPTLMIAGAFGAAWIQPTAVQSGSVAGVQQSFQASPVSVQGLNYIVSNALQYDQALRYVGADRDGRLFAQPIDISAVLRNNQYIATRQTIMFAEPYGLDEFNAFTLVVPAGYTVSISLLLDANAA